MNFPTFSPKPRTRGENRHHKDWTEMYFASFVITSTSFPHVRLLSLNVAREWFLYSSPAFRTTTLCSHHSRWKCAYIGLYTYALICFLQTVGCTQTLFRKMSIICHSNPYKFSLVYWKKYKNRLARVWSVTRNCTVVISALASAIVRKIWIFEDWWKSPYWFNNHVRSIFALFSCSASPFFFF